MRHFGTILAGALAACALSAPATAATSLNFNLGGGTATYSPAAPYTLTVAGVTLTARGYSYAATPNAFQTMAVWARACRGLGRSSPLHPAAGWDGAPQ